MRIVNALKNVVDALHRLELRLRNDEPLRREAGAIREAFAARATVIESLRRRNRKPKPKQKPMLVELFIPRCENIEAFTVELDVSSARGLESWEFWRKCWNGTA